LNLMSQTRDRILDTAERLFAERGPGATSLRSIIAAANVNLAAVHYHFRGKEALLDAVLKRRLDPVNRERIALLDECEQAADNGAIALECVLDALIAPALRLAQDAGRGAFVKLMGRILAEGDTALLRRHFGEVVERFLRAMHRALPELPPEELRWRAHFAVGAVAHTLVGATDMLGLTGAASTERLVGFIAAGFRAPVSAQTGSGS
jgi:AcrR family transcriptional regulator